MILIGGFDFIIEYFITLEVYNRNKASFKKKEL